MSLVGVGGVIITQVEKLQNSRLAARAKRAEENLATNARCKANKWDKDTAHIKRVLLSEAEPLLTASQKLTLKHVKTYLLENGRRFLCPALKTDTIVQVWNCVFPDKSCVPCLLFLEKKLYPQLKISYFGQNFTILSNIFCGEKICPSTPIVFLWNSK